MGIRRRLFRYTAGFACAFLLVYGSKRLYDIYVYELPSFEQLHNIEPSLATRIYGHDGTLLQEFFNENRALTPYQEFPPHLVDMLLAVEDRDFYDHWGINLGRTIRVVTLNFYNLKGAKAVSTITQQLARLLFVGQEKTLLRKLKEALTAVKLERTYSKQEILQMYLNQYYFGNGAYGINAASRSYFNKETSELSIEESAFLVGILKAPSRYGSDLELGRKVRDRALESYCQFGKISEGERDSLQVHPLTLVPPKDPSGRAPHFCEMVRQYIQKKYGDDILYSGGLQVVTTLDWRMQKTAEKAVNEKIDSLRARIKRTKTSRDKSYYKKSTDSAVEGAEIFRLKQIQGALLALDNATGGIVSLVGGRNFQESNFNRATQARRQAGSTFKPFVYTAAVDNGFRPMDIIYDNPIVLDIPGAKQWRPSNFDDKFLGPMTMRDGLRLSRNLVAINLLQKVGVRQVGVYAHKMGIESPIPEAPSIAIGANEVSLVELVSAYSVFPNGGIHVQPRFILKVSDRYGNVLEQAKGLEKEEALSAQTAYIMSDLLRTSIDNGTGRAARALGFVRPAGGKTGTTNNFTDNWFVGFSPQISCGVWFGFDDKTPIGRKQYGATNSLPVWTQFMKKAHDTLPLEDFNLPESIVFANIDLETGQLATDRCHDVRYEVFTASTVPIEVCHEHPSQEMYPGVARYDYRQKDRELNVDEDDNPAPRDTTSPRR